MKLKKFIALLLTLCIISSVFMISLVTASAAVFVNLGDYRCQLEGDGNVTIAKYNGVDKNLVLPLSLDGINVVGIADNAFENSDIESVIIPEGYTSIGNYAFYGAENISNITLPSTITSIGVYAFAYSSVENLDITSATELSEIPMGLVQNCENLEAFEIPASITHIDSSAFKASGLKSIVVPETVMEIGSSVFENCSNLETAIINGSLSKIPDYTFSGCTALTSFSVPATVTIIGDCAFRECTSMTEIEFSPFLTKLGIKAFYNATALEKIFVPTSVSNIGKDCFEPMLTDTSLKIQCTKDSFTSQYCEEKQVAYEELTPLTGDVNSDDEVNIRDVTAIQKYIAGAVSLSTLQIELADLDANKVINVRDVTVLQRSLVGITD